MCNPLSSNGHLQPERTQGNESKTGDLLFKIAEGIHRFVRTIGLDHEPVEHPTRFQRFEEPQNLASHRLLAISCNPYDEDILFGKVGERFRLDHSDSLLNGMAL
jgi:hypothetical protein